MKSPIAGAMADCLRAALVAVAWLSGITFTAWIAGMCLPDRELPWFVRQKIAHLAQHGDEYDVVFLGSSRMQFHIMPSVFDRCMAERGLDLKSFNAGVAAMTPPEDAYVLDEILRHPHGRLRWIFIELAPLRSVIDLERMGTERTEYWHDWERFILVTKRAIQHAGQVRKSPGPGPAGLRQEQIEAYVRLLTDWAAHVRIFAAKSVHFGRGAVLAGGVVIPKRKKRIKADDALGTYGDGWSHSGEARQRMSGETLAAYEHAHTERLQRRARKDTEDGVSDEALEILLAKVRRAGAVPILIVPPTPVEGHYFPPPDRARELAILDFSDVNEYPDLFRNENRQDINHLNAAGADVFTRILADRFLEIAQPLKSPHPPR